MRCKNKTAKHTKEKLLIIEELFLKKISWKDHQMVYQRLVLHQFFWLEVAVLKLFE
jgi:hypothetical protein